jgi:hypothetical protein
MNPSRDRPYKPPRLPLGLVAGAALLLLIPIIGCMAWLWLQWAALTSSVPWFTDTIRYSVFLLPVVFGAWGLGTGVTILWRRYGWRESIAAHYAVQATRAQTQVAPLASSYHQHIETTTAPALALPEPIEQIDVIKPMSEWMLWIDEQPHTLLGGKTKAGKTWLATALLERRIDTGYDIFVIDPHSSDWMGLPTAGGSGTPERRAALKAVMDEYIRRMGIREEHKRRTNHELPHDYFDPMVVLIDEANAMLEELAAEWKTVLKQVASGSRKVGIALLMLAQSPLVEDLGISGAMRENFSRIALDDRTVQTLIDGERDRPRKLALQAAFRTMDRPAAAQIGPHVWLLDRRGLAPGATSAGARIWAGWDFAQGCAASRVSPQNAPTTPLPSQQYFGNESNEAVTSPEAGVAPVATVAMSAAEIANIATLLMTLPPSEAAKKLDGYSPRKYAEYRTKVEPVKNLIGGTR